MNATILARTTTEQYRAALDGVVTALRKAGALRFDLPAMATARTTPAMDATLRRLAERAVAMLDENTLLRAKADAIRDVLEEDADLETLHALTRRAIDAYEARVR